MTIPCILKQHIETEAIETMVNTPVTKSKPSLDGMVFCARCGSEMTSAGKDYRCPNTTDGLGSGCSVEPVSMELLLRRVTGLVGRRLATEDNINRITASIQDTTEPNARAQRRNMEQAEAAISEANTQKVAVLQPVEYGTRTFDEVSEDTIELDRHAAGLAFEAMVARNELDKIEFIRDPNGIRNTINDPETYLGNNSPDEVQELLELLIQKVTLDDGKALILYQVPMPSAENPKGITEDHLDLTIKSQQ